MAGGGGYKSMVINFIVRNPVTVYCGGGISLLTLRYIQTRGAYNFWFGKQHFERRVAKGLI